jgi:hypothetical protein
VLAPEVAPEVVLVMADVAVAQLAKVEVRLDAGGAPAILLPLKMLFKRSDRTKNYF